jgi:hypothetical protein
MRKDSQLAAPRRVAMKLAGGCLAAAGRLPDRLRIALDLRPLTASPARDRPAKAGPTAHFDRNERYAYFGDRTLVHRVISRRHTVGFKRVWMRGVSEEHIRCDT